ncbi:putative transcription factor C2H2 family [Helianthus annuus]|nr:putative transcription factor C2H2 family [Helianthus annuus]
MFTISNKRGHARARLSPKYAMHSPFTSPTNGCSIPPEIFIPQMPQPVYPTILSGPNPSTTVDTNIDLKLRLGQPGTSVNEVRGTRRVTENNQTPQVPKDLMFTLGHDPVMGGDLSITEGPSTRILVQPTKTQKFASSDGAKTKKLDYYGPCVRCGYVFETSQRLASHMRAHYRMDETEEKKDRLAKRLQNLMVMKT